MNDGAAHRLACALPHMNTDRAKVVASKLKPTGATWLHGGKTEAHDELQRHRRARKVTLAGLRKGFAFEEGLDPGRVRIGDGCDPQDGDHSFEEPSFGDA